MNGNDASAPQSGGDREHELIQSARRDARTPEPPQSPGDSDGKTVSDNPRRFSEQETVSSRGSGATIAPESQVRVPDYELLRRIGWGSYGDVWLGRNLHDEQFYAIKVIPKDCKIELDGIREYKKRSKGHPKLVPIEHVGELDEHYYYVMPLADDAKGSSPLLDPNQYEPLTLKLYLKRRGPLPIDELLTIARDLLPGLDHLHAGGAVHCDVKPGNILRMGDAWCLGDHGLMVQSESVVPGRGTKGFWPPEGPRDRTADLYALGKTLFLAATGWPIEQFDEFARAESRIPGDDPRGNDLQRIILRACARQARDRYPNAARMQADLDRLSQLKPETAPAAGLVLRIWKLRLVLALTVVSCLAMAWLWKSLGTTGSEASNDASMTAQKAAPKNPISDAVDVDSMRIRRYSDAGLYLDDIGITADSARCNDDVRVHVELSRPAYSFLIALNPNGTHELQYPEDDSAPPTQTDRLDFPSGSSYFGLTDGVGLQGFVLVASVDPLPAYKTWRSAIGDLPWYAAPPNGVWRYANGQFEQLALQRGTIRTRGGPPEAFTETCAAIEQACGKGDVVHAMAFPVLAKEDADTRPAASP